MKGLPRGGILCIVGARPNYMKMAPLMRAFGAHDTLPRPLLVHTGQHYDVAMNDRLFSDLELPAPDLNLEVGSATHAVQTAEIMRRIEPVLDETRPACVVLVGDVNSTLAVALVAAKKAIPIAHVEAGLRSYDRAMPEEINRILTDQLSDLLYTTERSAGDNLAREGIARDRIHFVGNVMIDSVMRHRTRAVASAETLGREHCAWSASEMKRGFALVTLHRPSNVDDAASLEESLQVLDAMSRQLPVVWPVHPRTRGNIERFGLGAKAASRRIFLLPPQGYLEMLGLMRDAQVVLTDSGGIQEETTALAVPCLTMRENTERPITVDEGTNTLVGRDCKHIMACVEEILAGRGKRGQRPELWDGHAAERIASHLATWLAAPAETREHVTA